MIIKKKCISRRTMLRGAGVALALPLLDAMVPALTATAATVAAPANLKRIGYIYIPMGFNPKRWIPEGDTLDKLSFSLSPLEKVKNQVTVITNTDLQNAYPGSHATSNSAFLSAARAKQTESTDYYNGITVDQIAAKKIGQNVQLPSLELSMDILATVGQCDNGYACVYQNNLSWASPTQPLPSEAHPRLVFEQLFGEGGTPEQRRVALKKRASLLDSVTLEIKRIKNRVGASDRGKIDSYLQSIREVERRIQMAESSAKDNPLPDLDRPVGVPVAYADHARLMFDLQLLAFQGDITRVVSFQLAREASTRTYPEIGVSDPHHPVSHHGNDPEKLEKVAKINLYGSGMGDPHKHDHSNLPIIVAGGAAGKMRGGRHIRFKDPTPLSNVHLTLLNKVGVPMETFSDSTGTVDELFDPVDL